MKRNNLAPTVHLRPHAQFLSFKRESSIKRSFSQQPYHKEHVQLPQKLNVLRSNGRFWLFNQESHKNCHKHITVSALNSIWELKVLLQMQTTIPQFRQRSKSILPVSFSQSHKCITKTMSAPLRTEYACSLTKKHAQIVCVFRNDIVAFEHMLHTPVMLEELPIAF